MNRITVLLLAISGIGVILAIIALVFSLKITRRAPEAAAPGPQGTAPLPPPQSAPQTGLPEEIAAVIAAVIAAMEADQGLAPGSLVVKRIRRVGVNTPAWSLAGRREAIGR
jgi:hypothetical protein